MRDGYRERSSDPGAQLLTRPTVAEREIDADEREIDPDHDNPRDAVREHHGGGGEVALDRLHGIAEEPEARLPRAEWRIDRAASGAGCETAGHGVVNTRSP